METFYYQLRSNMKGPFVDKIFGDNASDAIADLIRTMFIRVEFKATVALLFAFNALAMTFVNMFGKEGQKKPLIITCAAICHLVEAILLGVALGAFAQQLQQITIVGDIFAMLTITDYGYRMLVMGFVLGSTLLAITHLLMLVSHLRQQKDPLTTVRYGPLIQNQDSLE